MHDIVVHVSGRDGSSRRLTVHAPAPSAWSADDALAFLHDLIHALDPGEVRRVPFVTWTLIIETNTGTAETQPLRLSEEAATELERKTFRLPWSHSVQ